MSLRSRLQLLKTGKIVIGFHRESNPLRRIGNSHAVASTLISSPNFGQFILETPAASTLISSPNFGQFILETPRWAVMGKRKGFFLQN